MASKYFEGRRRAHNLNKRQVRREQSTLSDIKIHRHPIWRNIANYRLVMKIDDSEELEELWAKQRSDELFEICCIPFFVYDVNLGDLIKIVSHEGKNLVLGVTKPSGHHTFRIALTSLAPIVKQQIEKAIADFGCQSEWFDERLISIDAPDDETANNLAHWLETNHPRGGFDYETGRTE